jgi:Protein of unknown function (DUF2384)
MEMLKQELESWLCGDWGELGGPSPKELAFLLGEDRLPTSSSHHRSIRFVLAVLRDIYQDESAVWHWLCRPRSDLNGARPADLLAGSDAERVEALAVREWNVASAAS